MYFAEKEPLMLLKKCYWTNAMAEGHNYFAPEVLL
jgi:hypothetical protein